MTNRSVNRSAIGSISMVCTERYTSYPECRESGVEWLGEIPAHWICLSMARVTRSRCDGPFGSGLKSQHYSVDGVRVIRLQNIGGPEFLNSDQVFVDESHADVLGDHSVLQGDLLIAGLGDDAHPVGRACVAPEGLDRAMVKADCFRFRLDPEKIVPEFAAYQLSANALAASGYLATGSTRSRMNLSTTAARKIALPPVAEQHAIVGFLNCETARISALVTKKEQLIELLQEKRIALITNAVTKGLNPDIPVKESGVEWLGKIPEHWQVRRTKHVARLESGHTPSRQNPNFWRDCKIPWFTLADVWQIRNGGQDYVTETRERVSELGLVHSAARLLPKGTVILSRTASVGFCSIMGVEMATTQDFVNWVCHSCLRPEYLLYVFRSTDQEFQKLTMGSTHRTIYMPDVAQFVTPLPPLAEQDQIVEYIRIETGRIDGLMDRVREAIKRLKELRTALISAAVTGKIDVRLATG